MDEGGTTDIDGRRIGRTRREEGERVGPEIATRQVQSRNQARRTGGGASADRQDPDVRGPAGLVEGRGTIAGDGIGSSDLQDRIAVRAPRDVHVQGARPAEVEDGRGSAATVHAQHDPAGRTGDRRDAAAAQVVDAQVADGALPDQQLIAGRAGEEDRPTRLIHGARRRRGGGVADVDRGGDGIGAVDDVQGGAEAGRIADVDLSAQGGTGPCAREHQRAFTHGRDARVSVQALEFPSAGPGLVDGGGASAIADDAGDAIGGMRAAQDQGGRRGPAIVADQ